MVRDGENILANCGGVGQGDTVELYNDDRCRTDLIAIVSAKTDCATFSGASQRVWGVKVNGQCLNIDDTEAQTACLLYRDGARRGAVEFYYDDRCRATELQAIIAKKVHCAE